MDDIMGEKCKDDKEGFGSLLCKCLNENKEQMGAYESKFRK